MLNRLTGNTCKTAVNDGKISKDELAREIAAISANSALCAYHSPARELKI
jgi:hypothetical protein